MKDDPDRTEQFKRENRMAQMAKLRIPWKAMGEMANIERALAAGTIQDLMDEVEAWQKAMQKAERDIAELRGMLEVANEMAGHYARERAEAERLAKRNALLVAEIETLREERDEARRLVCRHTKKTYRTLRETAEERGWDCFKEKP